MLKGSILDVRQGSEYASSLVHVLKETKNLGAKILYDGLMMVIDSMFPKKGNRVQITLRGF